MTQVSSTNAIATIDGGEGSANENKISNSNANGNDEDSDDEISELESNEEGENRLFEEIGRNCTAKLFDQSEKEKMREKALDEKIRRMKRSGSIRMKLEQWLKQHPVDLCNENKALIEHEKCAFYHESLLIQAIHTQNKSRLVHLMQKCPMDVLVTFLPNFAFAFLGNSNASWCGFATGYFILLHSYRNATLEKHRMDETQTPDCNDRKRRHSRPGDNPIMQMYGYLETPLYDATGDTPKNSIHLKKLNIDISEASMLPNDFVSLLRDITFHRWECCHNNGTNVNATAAINANVNINSGITVGINTSTSANASANANTNANEQEQIERVEMRNSSSNVMKRLDSVHFWIDLAMSEHLVGEEIYIQNVVNNDKKAAANERNGNGILLLRDPVKCMNPPIEKLVIRKILKSNTKPLLIDIYCKSRENGKSYLTSNIILKMGDDLRKDMAIMQVFKYMNWLWYTNNVIRNEKRMSILTYKVVSFSESVGCIELIKDCIPLRHIKILKSDMKDSHYSQLIASAAGSYIASFVMGIRDRHFDNILIRQSDCTLFHIDFNYMFGEKVTFDASPFGITQDFYAIVGKVRYNQMIDLALDGFRILRKHSQDLIAFAVSCFSCLYDQQDIVQFLTDKLRLKETEINACRWLDDTLKKAPFNHSTKWKNRIHRLAQPSQSIFRSPPP
ncbi:phosphoinositide-3-kinase, catalytic, gamma polypeptide [Reticulomyxa filosa]|uniref:Phosphoinositide-3-kinase, catalytic, gamma polypeptide n=1 Tax=Reticulomyxa filosa TaxID=46433 RepID=X6NKF6_RETFI|nr:phosphoinositide-3-kinase, catalytic, gamma polypeptide [Reticulomyxa filosa]|eukprot:ETO26224.1 phosphoinositide-3-kinase, catalytic, gamma polypeptide [Reticulomyxa filosa]